ncbi:MAG: RNA polymerase subunit sigma, partial [Proteobacteria bacterium]|nr:RNA polymerase subunit sigma [Pseudomonadota bacterium]
LVKIGTTQNQKKLFYQLQREKEQIDKLIESGNLKELAKKLDIPEDEVLTMVQRLSGRDVSLDKPTDDGGTSLLGFQRADTEAPDETLAKSENLLHLNEAIEALRPTLNEKELIILKERILNDEPLTLQEIGEKYGTTREAVRQMEARLLKKIKDKFAEIESQSQD